MMFGQKSGNEPPLSWAVFPTVTGHLPQKESSWIMTGKEDKKFAHGNGNAAGTRAVPTQLPIQPRAARCVQDASRRTPDARAKAPRCRAAGPEEYLHPRYFSALVKNIILYPSSCCGIWKRYKWVPGIATGTSGGPGAGKCRLPTGHLVPDTRSKEHQPFQAKKMKPDLVIPISVK